MVSFTPLSDVKTMPVAASKVAVCFKLLKAFSCSALKAAAVGGVTEIPSRGLLKSSFLLQLANNSRVAAKMVIV